MTTSRPLSYTTKTEALVQAILEMAATLPVHTRLPSMGELAKHFHVSKVTLDIALKEAAQRGAIVRKNGVGIFVSPTARQKTIGVVFGFDVFGANVSAFYRLLLQMARQQAAHEEMSVRPYLDLLDPKEGIATHRELMEDVANRRVDALIGIGVVDANIIELERLGLPMVHLQAGHDAPAEVYTVGTDFGQLVGNGVAALVQEGARKIALITPDHLIAGDGTAIPDLFRATLKAHRLPAQAPMILRYPAESKRPAFDQISWCRRHLLDFYRNQANSQRHPDAYLILDDYLTYGATLALEELGFSPGTEIMIASQTTEGLVLFENDHLIRLEINPSLIVEAMLEMLQTLLKGGQPDPPRQQIPITVHAALSALH